MSHLSYTQNFFIYFVLIVAVLLVSLNFIFAIHAPYKEKKTPFECGYHSFLQNRIQFVVSFFTFGLLFLLFDLEIVLIYPYSVSIDVNLMYGLILMVIFATTVTIGFVFEFGKKALTIDSRQFNLQEVRSTYESLLDAIHENFSSFDVISRQALGSLNKLIELNHVIEKHGSQKIDPQYVESLRENFKCKFFMMKMNYEMLDQMLFHYEGGGDYKGNLVFRLLEAGNKIRILTNRAGDQNLNTEIPDNLKAELKGIIATLAAKTDFSWSEIVIEKLKPVFQNQSSGTISELLVKGSSSSELSGSPSVEASSSIAKSTTFGPGLGIKPPSTSPSEVATGTTTPTKLPFR